MRCSSCERLLDRYVDGTLKAPQMRSISEHLRQCAACRELLQELKVVDALLETSSAPELPPNFTFAVMAETNDLPAPSHRQHPLWSFLALYVTAAWVAAVSAILVSGVSVLTIISSIAAALSRTGSGIALVMDDASRGITHALPPLAAFGAGILLIDLALAATVALLYFIIRPRLAARLGSSEVIP